MNKDIDPNRPYDPIWDMYLDEFEDMTPEEIAAWKERKSHADAALAITLTACDMPDKKFMTAMKDYINGKLPLEELEARVDRLEYL